LFTGHIKKRPCSNVGPFCNVLVVENGGWNASPIEFLFTDHFKKACFLAGFCRFSFRQSLLADVELRVMR
ncbi:hypothetical protein, partial [Vibrio vulnificus]|uniref:hypothetical protein n=1 Tax=Vibrio vulnificus TaxID=672 RepID=UPI004058838A